MIKGQMTPEAAFEVGKRLAWAAIILSTGVAVALVLWVWHFIQ